MNGLDLQERIIEAVSFLYPNDPCYPGVIISHLRSDNLYYVAIHRYKERLGKGKLVLFQTKDRTLSSALLKAANWVAAQNPQRNPLDTLQNYLKSTSKVSGFENIKQSSNLTSDCWHESDTWNDT